MDVPTANAYGVSSSALAPTSRAMQDASRFTHPLSTITGSSAQRGINSMRYSLALAHNR